MAELNSEVEDILTGVEDNFRFLHVGKFLDEYIKRNDLSLEAKNIQLELGDKAYRLKRSVISEQLKSYFDNKDKPNIFGYLVEWNAFRGIGMAMTEGLKIDSSFKTFVMKMLGGKYEHFHAILSFIRNVLSHNIDAEIRLKEDHYKGTREKFRRNHPSDVAEFTFKYDRDMPEITHTDYGFTIRVDFSELTPGKRFVEVISEWHLFMFAELCFNLVFAFRNQPSVPR